MKIHLPELYIKNTNYPTIFMYFRIKLKKLNTRIQTYC